MIMSTSKGNILDWVNFEVHAASNVYISVESI